MVFWSQSVFKGVWIQVRPLAIWRFVIVSPLQTSGRTLTCLLSLSHQCTSFLETSSDGDQGELLAWKMERYEETLRVIIY